MNIINNKLNPNPITKLFVLILMSFTALYVLNGYYALGIVIFISFMFLLQGFYKDSVSGLIVYLILFKIPHYEYIYSLPAVLKISLSMLYFFKTLYLPFYAGKFLVKTSDVGSVLASMDKLKISKSISIPIAVMLRFFPSFKEDYKNIRLCMKVRGINIINPIRFLEYILVPLLIISSNVSEDIAKAAEVKCIENPIKKSRYINIKIGIFDFLYAGSILGLFIGGLL